MAIHSVKIIESGHMSTVRFFELGVSFGICRSIGRWPSLDTMNAFLSTGSDDGALGTDIVWEPCVLTRAEYESAVASFMKGEPFSIDSVASTWDTWIEAAKRDVIA
jgi:hypothetical protein